LNVRMSNNWMSNIRMSNVPMSNVPISTMAECLGSGLPGLRPDGAYGPCKPQLASAVGKP
jgi:hypothetical protein